MNQSANTGTENLIQWESKNCYCLVFPNYKALDLTTIEDIFSNYGRVISVSAAGDERGYRFIRYPSLEEAQRAVDNVGNDYNITLKSHRPKNQRDKQRWSGKKDERNNNDKKSNSFDEPSRPKIPVWEHEVQESSGNSSCGESISDEPKPPSLYFIQRTQSMNSLPGSEYGSQPRSAVSEEKMIQRYEELQTLEQQVRTPISDSECVPDLVSSKNPEQQKIVVTAGEVVVGNIPTRFGAAYLLHLFDKHHPIAISYLIPSPRANANYCHVYFRSDKDALMVEREFDKYDLMGRRLVVMRPEKLMKIGAV